MARPRVVDEVEREALWAEGLDPDDLDMVAAISLVRWELSFCGAARHFDVGADQQTTRRTGQPPRHAGESLTHTGCMPCLPGRLGL
jgi:hypothetical protein